MGYEIIFKNDDIINRVYASNKIQLNSLLYLLVKKQGIDLNDIQVSREELNGHLTILTNDEILEEVK